MKKLLLFISFIAFIASLNSQGIRIGNDTSNPAASAIFELDGDIGGLSVPNLTSAQIATLRTNILTLTPAEISQALGMMVYQTDGKKGLYFFEGDIFVKYSPHGLVGTVGGGYDTTMYPSPYNFTPILPADGLGYTTANPTVGNYTVTFDATNYFDSYPIITITPENQVIAQSSTLPLNPVTCTPSFSANCSADFNSDQVEAVRVESHIALTCGGATEMQVLQNFEGFLPPTGANVNDIWPYPTNASSGVWMTNGIGESPGNPAGGDYVLQLSGGPWGPTSDCILQNPDPCVLQNGGGNYGQYLPDPTATPGSYCDNLYHPSDQSANQATQLTIRLGKGANDYFMVWAESSRQWSDELACWIDWNRDGDFTDAGEALGFIGDPSCSGQGSGTTSLCSGPGQFPVDAGAMGTGTAGQFIVPPTAELGLTTLRVVSAWAAPSLLTQPCRQSTWGETEDFVVEIYDCNTGSVVSSGGNYDYNPIRCTVDEIMQSGADYTGFKVSCVNKVGALTDTKVHWDATESTYY